MPYFGHDAAAAVLDAFGYEALLRHEAVAGFRR